MMITSSAPGRARHVFLRYLPMIVLGIIFLVIGLSPNAPHYGILPLGSLFALLGAIMFVGAVLGMIFTRCPLCLIHWRLMCLHEPDIFWDERLEDYYRDLAPEKGP